MRVVEGPAELAAAAADELFARVAAADADRPFAVALSGGSTPLRLFSELRRRIEGGEREAPLWRRVHLFWGDERAVPPDDPRSNFGAARARGVTGPPLPEGNVHRVRGDDGDAETAAAAYEAELRAFFEPPPSPPRFDLVLLGLGSDGHTASLFPGDPALEETGRWVAPVQRAPDGVPRVTLTLPVLDAAAAVLFLVAGESKAGILRRVLDEHPGGELPAARIRCPGGELLWLADRAAAGQLETDPG